MVGSPLPTPQQLHNDVAEDEDRGSGALAGADDEAQVSAR